VSTISGVMVAYADGTPIPVTTSAKTTVRNDITYDYQEIDIVFPRQNYGQGKNWQFKVSYTAQGLVETRGGGHTVYIPSIEAGDEGDGYTARVDVPLDFGTAHFPGAKSASGGTNDGRQFYNFDKAALSNSALALVFGDSTIYNLNFKFPLHNDSALPRTVTVALPPDLNNQHSYVNKLTPAPANTHLDADGNVLADYHLNPHQNLTVETDVSSEVKYLEYDLSASKKAADIPADLVRQYTGQTQYWQFSGGVADAAKSVVKADAPVIDNVKAMNQYVIDKLTYNKNKIQFNIRQGSVKALANPSNAVCLEYADLLIAMLRSQGIPARMPVGYAYSGNLKTTDTVSDSLHAWVEAYVPGIGWMTLDPTWGEKFDNFGKSDLDHVAFAVWGASDQTPTAVATGKADQNYQYEQTTLSYAKKVESTGTPASVKLTHYVILPFLAFDRATVVSTPQTASDNNQLTYGQHAVSLGSLAPSQKTVVYAPNIGTGWNDGSQVKFVRMANGQTLVLASVSPTTSYLPLYGLLGLILVAVLGVVVLRLRSRNAPVEAVNTTTDTPQPPNESSING
jgi:hypothetical protein